jgi:flagellar basal body-associated protein FliL
MATNEKTAAEAEQGSPAKGSSLPLVIVGIVAAVSGAAVPIALGMATPVAHSEPKPAVQGTNSNSRAMAFITYGDVTVNLAEARMNRYLRLKIVLHVRKSDQAIVEAALAEKDLVIRNWLVSHLSDKELDDIRGKAGQNMLRREIRDYFNTTLFNDNYERIYGVLFQEFNVQ